MRHHIQVVLSVEAATGPSAIQTAGEAMASVLNVLRASGHVASYVVEELNGNLLPSRQQIAGGDTETPTAEPIAYGFSGDIRCIECYAKTVEAPETYYYTAEELPNGAQLCDTCNQPVG
jgi:hypothetical protein